MKMVTFSEIVKECRFQAGPSFSPTDPASKSLVSRAINRLMEMGDWAYTTAQLVFTTTNNTISLPYNAEAVRGYAGCWPGPVHVPWYEYHANGPGALTWQGTGLEGLIDEGPGHPCFFDMHRDVPCYVAAFGGRQDAGKRLSLDLFTSRMELRHAISIPVQPWKDNTEGLIFTVISVARGYIIRRWFNARLQRAAQRMAEAMT